MSIYLRVAGFIVFLGALSPAFAQDALKPSYDSEDVIKFLAQQMHLGKQRAICIGTKSECAAKQPSIQGFDMKVGFNLASATLLPEAEANLQVVAKALNDKRLNSVSFRVDGYTDASGSKNYNKHLSEERAAAVTKFLVSQNVDPSRIKAQGLGESSPVVPNVYDPRNRRVELKLNVE